MGYLIENALGKLYLFLQFKNEFMNGKGVDPQKALRRKQKWATFSREIWLRPVSRSVCARSFGLDVNVLNKIFSFS